MAKKSKPLHFKNITEGNIYLVKRHGYANFYRLNGEEIQFYTVDKGKWSWTNTVIDTDNIKFIPMNTEEMMTILLENKTLDDKKR